jgi:hypothetical protein
MPLTSADEWKYKSDKSVDDSCTEKSSLCTSYISNDDSFWNVALGELTAREMAEIVHAYNTADIDRHAIASAQAHHIESLVRQQEEQFRTSIIHQPPPKARFHKSPAVTLLVIIVLSRLRLLWKRIEMTLFHYFCKILPHAWAAWYLTFCNNNKLRFTVAVLILALMVQLMRCYSIVEKDGASLAQLDAVDFQQMIHGCAEDFMQTIYL